MRNIASLFSRRADRIYSFGLSTARRFRFQLEDALCNIGWDAVTVMD